jgi:hypothetical protein
MSLSMTTGPAQAATTTTGTTPVVIDDFTTGPYTFTAVGTGLNNIQYQSGAGVIGAARLVAFDMGDNPRNTPATLDMGSEHHLNLTLGPRQSTQFELIYGYAPNGSQVPLNLDLTNRAEIVISFDRVVNPANSIALNVYTYSGPTNAYSYWANNVPVPSPDQFEIHVPLTEFHHNEGTDQSNVNLLRFIIGARVSMAIDRIELR